VNRIEPVSIAPGKQGCEAYVCPLSRVRAGRVVRIRRLDGPPEVSQRLRELGFCEDRTVKLVSSHTNLICQVCDTRLGISQQLAERIWVEAAPPKPGPAHGRGYRF
jgi:ferrous iron transport protein A